MSKNILKTEHVVMKFGGVTAVNDLSPALTAEIAKMYSAKAYASPEELVKADDVDLVFVLSPDQYHHDIAKLAIEARLHREAGRSRPGGAGRPDGA